MGAPTRQQDIVKILPHIGVFFQVNDGGSLVPPVINEELNSTHARTVWTGSQDVNRSHDRLQRNHAVRPSLPVCHAELVEASLSLKHEAGDGSKCSGEGFHGFWALNFAMTSLGRK
jgi:hypothetical protein